MIFSDWRSQIFEKNSGGSNLNPAGLNQTQTLREKCPNTELFLYRIFLCLDWVRSRNNTVFGHFSSSVSEGFAISLSLDHKFPLKLHTMIACDNIQHMLEVKPTKESGARTWAKRAKIRPEIRFFVISSSLHYLFSLILHMITAWDNF